MAEQRYLNASEVALLVGCTVPILNMWYKWKSEEPDNEVAKLLPEFIRIGNRRTRYWKPDDVYKIIEFRRHIPRGRNGIMGKVSQRYSKKRRSKDE